MLYKTILLLPLVNFILLGLISLNSCKCNKLKNVAVVFATVLLGFAFALSSVAFYDVVIMNATVDNVLLFNWFNIGDFNVDFSLMIDKLSVVMLFVVSLISFMVHIYSTEYMKNDASKVRFFCYLGLFTFVMFMLVGAENLLMLFLGWEGVGVASYLLIGFWHHKKTATAAGMKAFLINRVADLALIGAIILLFVNMNTLSFDVILNDLSPLDNNNLINIVAILLFIGAMGKSAQFGFHTWLPDAMEGPTPVSALIHSATMVSAGVFLVCRMSGLFEISDILPIVAVVGMVTAIFASLVGLAQKDIKKVIAYSTCSQLGYMFFACGVSAYSAAMFHLFTHAFFKALLFLGAGAVIHGCHDEQNIKNMGGLRKALPYTYVLMWIGSLALLGVPPFGGYFSKDFILEAGLMSGTDIGTLVYTIGTIGAMLTAIYSCKVMFMVFSTECKLPKKDAESVHEANRTMLIPMVILAIGAVFAGYLGKEMTSVEFWNGAITILNDTGVTQAHHTPFFFKVLPLILVILGVVFMYFVVLKGYFKNIFVKTKKIENVLENKFYIDQLYEVALQKPYALLCKLTHYFDKYIIDGVINGLMKAVMKVSNNIKPLQTGYTFDYIYAILVAVIVSFAVLIAYLI